MSFSIRHHNANLVLSALIMAGMSYQRKFQFLYLASEKFMPVQGLFFRTKSQMKKKTNLLHCSRKAKIKRRKARA
jgi:hypothetical protein